MIIYSGHRRRLFLEKKKNKKQIAGAGSRIFTRTLFYLLYVCKKQYFKVLLAVSVKLLQNNTTILRFYILERF